MNSPESESQQKVTLDGGSQTVLGVRLAGKEDGMAGLVASGSGILARSDLSQFVDAARMIFGTATRISGQTRLWPTDARVWARVAGAFVGHNVALLAGVSVLAHARRFVFVSGRHKTTYVRRNGHRHRVIDNNSVVALAIGTAKARRAETLKYLHK